jgi:hypothetical protein
MKNFKLLIIPVILFALIVVMSFMKGKSTPKFYYAFTEKISLSEISNKIVLTFDTIINKSQFDPLINAVTNNYTKSISGNSMIIETNSFVLTPY